MCLLNCLLACCYVHTYISWQFICPCLWCYFMRAHTLVYFNILCMYVMKTHNSPLCNCRSLSLSPLSSSLPHFRSFTQNDTTVTTITTKTNSQNISELGYLKWKGTNPMEEKIVTKQLTRIFFYFVQIYRMNAMHTHFFECVFVYLVETRVQTKGIVETV